ncbi:uncharacterized protein TNCV_3712461 [Trichonephila clavipes]|nr:uncharacterized protein TNCV_3712461 [Trichonephila clavipes]
MASFLKTLISELEENIVPGMLHENISNFSSYRRRMERLAGILKFQELLKLHPVPVTVVMNENGFHITDCVWIVSDPCSCQPDCLVCGRGEEPPHDCAIHVLLESLMFQERMLHGEPTECFFKSHHVVQNSPASSTLSISCYGWKGWQANFRLVDVGALLGRSKVYKFAKRFDNIVIQGKDVLPDHKQYPIMT